MTWQESIRDWLDDADRSQAWLARKAGMDGSYLSMLLSGQRIPGLRVLMKLDRAMGLPAGTLDALRSQTQLPLEEVTNGHE